MLEYKSRQGGERALEHPDLFRMRECLGPKGQGEGAAQSGAALHSAKSPRLSDIGRSLLSCQKTRHQVVSSEGVHWERCRAPTVRHPVLAA